MINVKIARTPGPIVQLMLNDGATIADAAAIAERDHPGVEFSGSKVSYRLDSCEVPATTVLKEGNAVSVFDNLKAGMPLVKVARVPGSPFDVNVPDGLTYKQIIDVAVAEAARNTPPQIIDGSLEKTIVRCNGNEVVATEVAKLNSSTMNVLSLFENLKGGN